MRSGQITLLSDFLFGTELRCGQIRAACSRLAPEFYTSEAGYRQLTMGVDGHPDDREKIFKPWRRGSALEIAQQIAKLRLPPTFKDFDRLVRSQTFSTSRDAEFVEDGRFFGYGGGFLRVNGHYVNDYLILSLGVGIPILRHLVSQGTICNHVALGLLVRMLDARITEQISDELYAKLKYPYFSRFEFEFFTAEGIIATTVQGSRKNT